MSTDAERSTTSPLAEPIGSFSDGHQFMLNQLPRAAELPKLIAAANQARSLASDLLHLMDDMMLPHNLDEEKELFPAVQRSAAPGDEAIAVQALVERLVADHQNIDRLWKRIAPSVRAASKGSVAEFDADLLGRLFSALSEHAKFEEESFLPLAQRILSRDGNHMDALGLALHLRHATSPLGLI